MIKGPGDHILQWVAGRCLSAGNPAHPGHRPFGSHLSDSLAQGDIGESRGKSHAIQKGNTAINSLFVQRLAIIVQGHARWCCQTLLLIGIRSAVILLQNVHGNQACAYRRLHRSVATPSLGKGDYAYIVLLHQPSGFPGVGDIDEVRYNSVATYPINGLLQ